MKFNFVDLFVEKKEVESTDNNNGKSSEVIKNEPVKTDPVKPSVDDVSSESSNTGVKNKEILDKLCNYLENCNLPGPDYMELKKAASSDAMNVIPDEAVRFQAAFATLKSMSPDLTKEKILSSIDAYVNELDKQANIAANQVNERRKVDVDDKKELIKSKETEITKLSEQIKNITDEISVIKENVEKLDKEYTENIKDFNNAVDLIKSNLLTDKKVISEKLIG